MKEERTIDAGDVSGAIRGADWHELLPKLRAFAARLLRQFGLRDDGGVEPAEVSAEQLVQDAVAACLSGRRTWDAGLVDLVGLLRGVIKSLAWSSLKSRRRASAASIVLLEGAAEAEPSVEDVAVEREGDLESLRGLRCAQLG